jgi:hypothetical protein
LEQVVRRRKMLRLALGIHDSPHDFRNLPQVLSGDGFKKV